MIDIFKLYSGAFPMCKEIKENKKKEKKTRKAKKPKKLQKLEVPRACETSKFSSVVAVFNPFSVKTE